MNILEKIKPLKNLSLVDKVEIRLLQFFKENNLKPGDAIPKETDFAEALGVSRTVIREALLRLRTIGIIESKKRKGMTLTNPDIAVNLEKIMNPEFLTDEDLKNLFDLRLVLEIGMIDFLFHFKTEKDVEELEKIVASQEEKNYKKEGFSLEKEVAFHGKLYEISKNTTLMKFQNVLLPVFEYIYKQQILDENKTTNLKNTVTHRELVEILKTNNSEAFRKALRAHLEPHFSRSLT